MAAAEPLAKPIAPRSRFWRDLGLAVVVAIPTALASSALAGMIVALVAVPVAFALTHDAYLALFAVSYGIFAAALALQVLLGASVAWALVQSFVPGSASTHGRAAWQIGGGIIAGLLGLLVGQVPLLGPLAARWRYGPTLALDAPQIGIIALCSLLAGTLAWVRRGRTPPPSASSWQAAAQPHISAIAWFVLPLALLLTTWLAILAVLGRV
jgi:hypothetical protein